MNYEQSVVSLTIKSYPCFIKLYSMDIIITAIGEFIWTSSCAIIDFCLSSGVSALIVFVSFLGAILASAFYKYAISRENLFSDVTIIDDNADESLISNVLPTKHSNQTQTHIYTNEFSSDVEEEQDEELQMKEIDDISYPFRTYESSNDDDEPECESL
ncbi:hypothetical protein I4U23_026579 [Adineta vaga]|nr:hypothetical protein I4U23_026579 [Adineta vaga]